MTCKQKQKKNTLMKSMFSVALLVETVVVRRPSLLWFVKYENFSSSLLPGTIE